MRILAIATRAGSAACFIENGRVVAAAREECFSRVRKDSRFPVAAIAYCLEEAALESAEEIDEIAVHYADDAGADGVEILLRVALPEFHGAVTSTRAPFPVSDASAAALGPAYSSDEIREFLDRFALPYHVLDPREVDATVSRLTNDRKRVGVFRGRMEFGSTSAGHRSIVSPGGSTPFETDEEPIVCSPADAYRCMMRAGLDCLVIEDVLVWRHEQPAWGDEPA